MKSYRPKKVKSKTLQTDARQIRASNRWKKLSEEQRKRFPLCLFCGKASTSTHHIIPIHVDKSLAFDYNNTIPLCEKCHDEADAGGLDFRNWQERYDKKYGRDNDEGSRFKFR